MYSILRLIDRHFSLNQDFLQSNSILVTTFCTNLKSRLDCISVFISPQIDKSVLKCWGVGECQDERLLKVWCHDDDDDDNSTAKCDFLLNVDGIGDTTVGVILLLTSLILLSICLILIVKLLRSLLQGTLADLIKKCINSDLPKPFGPLTGYLAIVSGAVLTFLVQSSSVFTSTLTPLVGVGLITLERVYPLTLGANLGTTTTALLAAFASDPSNAAQFRASIQIALCHLFFNLTGVLLFYPAPCMRWPLNMSRCLGRTTAKYRWFAVFYLLLMFFALPAAVLTLSLAGTTAFLVVSAPLIVVSGLIIVINVLQRKVPKVLPGIIRDWNALPLWMHSLSPLDKFICKLCTCLCCCCPDFMSLEKVEAVNGDDRDVGDDDDDVEKAMELLEDLGSNTQPIVKVKTISK